MNALKSLLCASLLAACATASGSPVHVSYVLDHSLKNETGTTANDFHLTLTFSSAAGIGFTNPGPGNFVLPGVTGTFGTNSTWFDGPSLNIDLSGAVVQPGINAMLHIPIPVVGSPTFEVTSAYWTFGGERITTGTQPDKKVIHDAFARVVPEPASLSLLLFAGLGWLGAKRLAPTMPVGGAAAC